MLKWGSGIAVVLVLIFGAAYLFREQIFLEVMKSQMAPDGAFDEAEAPMAPDYANNEAWSALPELEDGSDFVPDQLAGQAQSSGVAVFFVHPTTYLSDAGWNAPIDDAESSRFRDDMVMQAQASVFNGCCEIYAPKYRQATLWSFLDETGSGDQARTFAFTDVERAFDEFITRIGDRPFILAGHSQGADHTARLLESRITGTDLKDRMVAAYPVGFGLDPDDMRGRVPDIPICENASQTGCYVTWNSMGANAMIFPDYIGAVCVNPLSWSTNRESVPASQNLGSLSLTDGVRYEEKVSSAQCQNDRLLVGEFQSDMFDELPYDMGEDNYHLLDFSLFYGNIRKNAQDRVAAFLAAQSETAN